MEVIPENKLASRFFPLPRERVSELAERRGYRQEFIQWFSDHGLIRWNDYNGGRWCFPVIDAGEIVAFHQIPSDKRQPTTYFPKGKGVHPLIVGDIAKAAHIFVFESQWDAMAAIDAADFHLKEKGAYIATRGASNGLSDSLPIPQGKTIYAVMQNDEEKNGKIPAEGWLKKISEQKQWPTVRVDIPKQFEDPQDWLKKEGHEAFRNGLRTAVQTAVSKNEENQKSQSDKPDKLKYPTETEGLSGKSGKSDGVSEEIENEREPFPAECLPKIAQRIIAGFIKMTDSRMPLALPSVCCLGTISAAIGPTVRVRSTATGETTGANIYLLAAAESSSGKSIPFKRITKPFFEVENELRAEHWDSLFPRLKAEKDQLEAERQGMLNRTKQGKGKLEDRENLIEIERRITEITPLMAEPRLFCGDSTSPAIVRLMARQSNECLTSISDDAQATIEIIAGKFNKTGNSDDTFFIQSWTGNPFAYDRATDDKNLVLSEPWLSALWLTQPARLKALTENEQTFQSGFFQRLLVCDTGATPLPFTNHANCFSPETESEWNSLIRSLLKNFRLQTDCEPMIVEPSKEAETALRDYQNECVKKQSEDFSDIPTIAGKWGENAWRIALNIHMAEQIESGPSARLEIATAMRAIEIAKWFAKEALRVVAPAREEKENTRAERLRMILQRDKYEREIGASKGTLLNNHGFPETELRNLCSRYPRQFELIDKETTKKGGKPTFFVRIRVADSK